MREPLSSCLCLHIYSAEKYMSARHNKPEYKYFSNLSKLNRKLLNVSQTTGTTKQSLFTYIYGRGGEGLAQAGGIIHLINTVYYL